MNVKRIAERRRGFVWDKKPEVKVMRDLSKCPECGEKITVLKNDRNWIYEECEFCGLKRRRRL